MVPVSGDVTSPVFDAALRPSDKASGELYRRPRTATARAALPHSNDFQVSVLAPVFNDSKRCAFVLSWAHFADIGGMRPAQSPGCDRHLPVKALLITSRTLIDPRRCA